MKREIKFRAWHKGLKEMLPNIQNHIGNDGWAFGQLLNNIDTFEIMQFTGVKDKNGIELFEGDICKIEEWYPSDFKEVGFIGEIMFEDGSFFIYREAEKHPHYQELDSSSVSNRNIIKIGNKFENAELL